MENSINHSLNQIISQLNVQLPTRMPEDNEKVAESLAEDHQNTEKLLSAIPPQKVEAIEYNEFSEAVNQFEMENQFQELTYLDAAPPKKMPALEAKKEISLDCYTVWEVCLRYIKDRIAAEDFITWFEPIQPIKIENFTLTIQIPDRIFYEWIEKHCVNELRQALDVAIGKNGKLSYALVANISEPMPKHKPLAVLPLEKVNGYPYHKNTQTDSKLATLIEKNEYWKHLQGDFQLNPHHTFENFIEGDCNRLARNAGYAIADKPGQTSFNPLMFYGGVGLGKTHLLHAIGNHITKYTPEKQVVYISIDKFTNQFINSLKNNNAHLFTDFYTQVDVLLLDDVQFLAGKDKMQEMFFNIFNTLKQNGKQIVLTSDCPPKELKGLSERLISRFKSGLTADLQQPDLETRMAILHKKIQDEGMIIPDEVVEYLAHSVDSNIRELEGAIISLVAQASFNKQSVNLDLAKKTVQKIVQPHENSEISIDDIQYKVSDYFGLQVQDLKDKTRKKEIVLARQIAMYLAKKYTEFSLKSIGYHFGGRDHSTVIHAIQTVEETMAEKREVKAHVEELMKKF